ncbi:MAG: hypothetical protein ACYTAN_02350 [Planctomycetota bacterium]|jgi:peptidyl-prolyl cis-trans isomerase D
MAFGMKFFRKHQAKLLIVLVVLLIIAWLVMGTLARILTPDLVRGKIFGREVTDTEWRTAASTLALVSPTRPSDDDIWLLLAVLSEADRLGVTVTDEEVTTVVREWVRARTGASDETLDTNYEALLRAYRVTDDWVRYVWRNQLRAAKIREIFGGAFTTGETERWRRFVEKNMKIAIKRLVVPTGKFNSDVPEPAEEQLSEYFDAHRDFYLIPDQATVEYAVLQEADRAGVVTVTEEEIAEYYEENKVDKYLRPLEEQEIEEGEGDAEGEQSEGAEEGSEDDGEGAAEGAEEPPVEAEGEASEDTSAVAEEEGSPEEYIQPPEDLPEAVAEEPPVETVSEVPEDTSAVAEAEERPEEYVHPPEDIPEEPAEEPDSTEPLYLPLEDVRDEIRSMLEARAINAILADMRYDFDLSEDKDLRAVAERYGFKYLQEGPFAATEQGKLGPLSTATLGRGLSAMDDIFRTASSIEDFSKAPLVEASATQGDFLYRVLSFEPERAPELAEVVDKVTADYIRAEGAKLAEKEAGEILERLKTEGWAPFEEAGEYTIEETELANEGIAPPVLAAAAGVEIGDFGEPVPIWGAVRIFQVLDREEPEYKSFEEYEAGLNRLRPLVARFGLSTVLQFFAQDGGSRQAAMDIWTEQSERRAFVDRWEQDLLERANVEKREIEEPAPAGESPPDES